jgi:hypothetical protein
VSRDRPQSSSPARPRPSSLSEQSECQDFPTLPPPFDLEEFARGRSDDGDRRVAPSDCPTEPALRAPSGAVRASRIGSFDQVPRLAVSLHSLRGRSLDHQAGFLLSRVDGASTLEVLLDVSAMPRLDALRLVARHVDDGILRLERRGGP